MQPSAQRGVYAVGIHRIVGYEQLHAARACGIGVVGHGYVGGKSAAVERAHLERQRVDVVFGRGGIGREAYAVAAAHALKTQRCRIVDACLQRHRRAGHHFVQAQLIRIFGAPEQYILIEQTHAVILMELVAVAEKIVGRGSGAHYLEISKFLLVIIAAVVMIVGNHHKQQTVGL